MYQIKDGIYNLDFQLSALERKLVNLCCNHLESKGFKYLSIPSSIMAETLAQQQVVELDNVFHIDVIIKNNYVKHYLAGSAEQGILQYLSQQTYPLENYIYAINSCFRTENDYQGLYRVKEFIKVEQFCLTSSTNWQWNFDFLLDNATEFLQKFDFIKYRITDRTKLDPGYHLKKYDIEVKTKQYGWMETHSCTYFGDEQIKKFNIAGDFHTISNTGIASPRILIPFMEEGICQI